MALLDRALDAPSAPTRAFLIFGDLRFHATILFT
jgi:hypothetical protein